MNVYILWVHYYDNNYTEGCKGIFLTKEKAEKAQDNLDKTNGDYTNSEIIEDEVKE